MTTHSEEAQRGSAQRFVIVGTLGAIAHISFGALFIQLGIHPLIANIFAFLLAFSGGFLGHHFYSFRGHGRPITYTFMRFFPVAIASFLLNETLLAGLLELGWFSPTLSLVISSLSVAVFSYLLGRFWAFRKA